MNFHELVRYEAKRQGKDLKGLSLGCGKSKAWLDRILAEEREPGLFAAIRLAAQLKLPLDAFADAVEGADREALPFSYAKSRITELARELSLSALAELDVAADVSTLDQIVHWWKTSSGEIGRLGPLTDFVDVYHPPRDGRMKAISIGAKSLSHRTLPKADVETLNQILAASDPALLAPLVEAQSKAVDNGVHSAFVQLRAPVSDVDHVHLDYFRFLFRASDNGVVRVVNYSKII